MSVEASSKTLTPVSSRKAEARSGRTSDDVMHIVLLDTDSDDEVVFNGQVLSSERVRLSGETTVPAVKSEVVP